MKRVFFIITGVGIFNIFNTACALNSSNVNFLSFSLREAIYNFTYYSISWSFLIYMRTGTVVAL